MLKNYWRTALRNLRNNKGYSLINITGPAAPTGPRRWFPPHQRLYSAQKARQHLILETPA